MTSRAARGWCLLVSLALVPPVLASDPTPDELEMNRLHAAADEAMASNDPSGAALFIGRAALMASHLAARQRDDRDKALFAGRETLYRAQERLYRALALFRLAGGIPPASAGVCGMLEQGATMADAAANQLRERIGRERLDAPRLACVQQEEAYAAELVRNAQAMRYDVQCP